METEILNEYLGTLNREKINLKESVELRIDSRKVEAGDIFLAIRGEKNDANDFIDDVLSKGAALVISDKKESKEKYGEKILLVSDSIKFLQDFSSFYRDKIAPVVVGITGSNGKTTTKDFLYSILTKKGIAKKTLGNLNNHIGVPLTLLQLKKGDEYIVVEMGMSGFGEIDLLAGIAKPDYGIITNIGDSHMEYMKTRENVYIAKTEIIKHVKKKMILNGDDEYLKKESAILAGFGSNCTVAAVNAEYSENGAKFNLSIGGIIYEGFEIALAGEHNVLDAVLAAAAALEIGIDIQSIKEGLKTAEFTKMRFEKIDKGNIIYINDAYNASPVSMKYSLETFSEIYNDGITKIAVLGDMLELGEESRKFHEELGQTINRGRMDMVCLYGAEMRYLYDAMKETGKVFHFDSKEKIKEKLREINSKKVILLKGSRGMKMEDIIE